jgi:hypothetical protein
LRRVTLNRRRQSIEGSGAAASIAHAAAWVALVSIDGALAFSPGLSKSRIS